MTRIENTFNPFPGLRPFNMDEDYLFFGREQQITDLLTLLRKHRFIAVVGTSGSGKSSVVRAGLLPELLGGAMTGAGSSWEIALMRPGANPIRHLARALCQADLYDVDDDTEDQVLATLTRSSLGLSEAVKQSDLEEDDNLLVVVDQFEEIFRFHQTGDGNEDVAAAFVNLLLEAGNQKQRPIYIVLTMRSDFLGDCAQFNGLAEAINHGEYLIPRLNREQLRSAIEGPVKVGGGEISFRLVQELLNDVGRDQDQLPVLQHALMRTWEYCQADASADLTLDLPHYESAGGMDQALNQHADEIFDELPSDDSRRVCEQLFKAVTEFGADNRGIRRPVRLGKLCDILGAAQQDVCTVVDAFRQQGRTFLMPMTHVSLTPETVIDVSHESLMRVWVRLRDWVEEEAASARIYRRLAETSSLFHDDKAGLYRDPDLQIALDWRTQHKPTLAWAQRYHDGYQQAIEFLDQSELAKRQEQEAKETARLRELAQAQKLAETEAAHANEARRSAQRLRSLVLVMALISVIAGGASVAAIVLKRGADVAKEQAEEARRDAIENEANAVEAAKAAKVAATEADIARENALRQSTRADAEAKKAKAALDEIERANRTKYFHQINLADWSWQSGDVDATRDFLSACPYDLRGWEWSYFNRLNNLETRVIYEHPVDVLDVAFSSDNRTLGVTTADHKVILLKVETGELLATLDSHTAPVTAIAFQGRYMATGSEDKTVKLWNIRSKRELFTLSGHTGGIRKLAFTPSGNFFASAAEDQTVKIWNAISGKEVITLTEFDSSISTLRFGSRGERLITGTSSGRVQVWDRTNGKMICELIGHEAAVTDVAIVPWSINRLITTSLDGTVRAWIIEDREQFQIFRLPPGDLKKICIRDDVLRLATLYDKYRVQVFRVTGCESIRELPREDLAPLNSIAFSRNGKWLVTAGKKVTLQEQDDLTLRGHNWGVRAVALSPDGERMASVAGDVSFKLFDARTGKSVGKRPSLFSAFGNKNREHTTKIRDVDFSSDSKLIATASEDTNIKLRNGTTGRIFRTLSGHTETVSSVEFSPDCKLLLSGSYDRTLRLWDVAEGKEVKQLTGHNGLVKCVAWSPSGKEFASASTDKTVRIWNPETADEIAKLQDHDNVALAVAYSPDGRFLATGGADTTILLYDAKSKELIRRLTGHTDSVTSLAFSPDGTRLLSGCLDDTTRLWETAAGQEIYRFNGQSEQSVAFDPTGRRIASSSANGHVSIFNSWPLEQIVEPTSTWKWLHPIDGVDPAVSDADFHTSFFKQDFDDSQWNVGRDGVGPNRGFGHSENGFEGVDIGLPESPHRKTAYFRHRFTTEKAFDGLTLNLRRDLKLDDGFIVYLDGAEVLSDNIPSSHAESFDLLSKRAQVRFQTGVTSMEIAGQIEPGEHVLAVSLHNNSDDNPILQVGEISLDGRAIETTEEATNQAVSHFARPTQPRPLEVLNVEAPKLRASAFEHPDPDAKHVKSYWQIRAATSDEYKLVEVTLNDDGEPEQLTRLKVTPKSAATTYLWRVYYEDSNGRVSRFCQHGSFTTPGETLVAPTSTWRYLHPTDGVDPAVADEDFHSTFFKQDFDDSAWQVGDDSPGPTGGFGYGDFVGVKFEIPETQNRKTAYFRHQFNTTEAYNNILLKMQFDDAIIVYLDGVEVLRRNVVGEEAYDLFSRGSVSVAFETKVNSFSLDTIIEPGDHTLAISLHNRSGGSSDLRIAEITLVGMKVKPTSESEAQDAGN